MLRSRCCRVAQIGFSLARAGLRSARARRDLLLQPRGTARRQGLTANSGGQHAGSEFFDLILVTTTRAATNC